MTRNYLLLAIWIIVLLAVGSAFGIMTKNNISSWYVMLNRSSLTPPNYVFSITWTILYIMIAISGWLIWQAKNSTDIQSIKKIFIIQLILNWLWTPLFFYYHYIGIALIWLIFIIIFLYILLKLTYYNLRIVFYLLLPYFLWVVFASYLNFYIWLYN